MSVFLNHVDKQMIFSGLCYILEENLCCFCGFSPLHLLIELNCKVENNWEAQWEFIG